MPPKKDAKGGKDAGKGGKKPAAEDKCKFWMKGVNAKTKQRPLLEQLPARRKREAMP